MQISTIATAEDFSFLDQKDFQQKYVLNDKQIRFYVGGIRCGKCVRKLEDLPLTVPGLRQLRVEMAENLAFAEIDSAQLTLAELTKKIADLGFKPVPLAANDSSSEVRHKEDRHDLIRLAVAGACAGNIMTFSFTTYFGETGAFYSLFSWVSFVLYLPVVSYVAWPFYKGAWNSLRQRQVSIDLPMAVASLAGFIYSVSELLRGGKNIYFDSLSGFLFLILVSRWGQKKMQRHFLRAREIFETFNLEKVKRLSDGGYSWTPVEHLKRGDLISVATGDTLPAEGELVSSRGHLSLAWISGELETKNFLRGAVVPAGARVQAASLDFKVTNLLPDTAFGKILEEVQKFNLSKNRLVSQADRWAQKLLLSVFAIAASFLVLYWNVSSADAIQRSLALIILACPCAMAFGTPLALAAALKKTQRKGLVVRNANVFENLQKVKTVFLDKTGTLTDTDLSLVSANIPESYRKIILALENNSHHPIAFAFRRAFSYDGELPEVSEWKDAAGYGVSGTVCGKNFRLAAGASHAISCALYENNLLKYNFYFTAALKTDALATVHELRKRGYRVCLLSGDKKDSVQKLGSQLGFTSDDIFYAADPAQKAKIVSSHPGAMMVGDGMNDSLAMMKASVGVATSGGVEAALRSSDVYLTKPSLKQLLTLIDTGAESLALIQQNLFISVIYNVIGGTLALAGFVNPFVAAVLMPVSSGFIILSTWLRSRE